MCVLSKLGSGRWKMSLRNFVKLCVLLWKEVNEMAAVYATLIIKGRRTFASVPETLKEQVREILIALECEHLIIEE